MTAMTGDVLPPAEVKWPYCGAEGVGLQVEAVVRVRGDFSKEVGH